MEIISADKVRICTDFSSSSIFQPIGIYKMYLEEVRDLRISMRDSPAFLNLILDFTIASPSLSAEYKVNLQPHGLLLFFSCFPCMYAM